MGDPRLGAVKCNMGLTWYRSGENRKWLCSGRQTYLTQAIIGTDDTLAIPASFQDGTAVSGVTAREAHLALV